VSLTRRCFIAGGAAIASLPARGARAQARVPRVGVVSGGERSLANFLAGLRDAGWVPGQTVIVEHRPTEGEADRYDAAVASVLATGLDVLVVTSPHGITAARRLTSLVPVVAVDLESDPVASNFVSSLARPGFNLTGLFLDIPEMSGKLVQLLQEARPGLGRVGIVWDANIAGAQLLATEQAARTAGLLTRSLPIRGAADIEPAIAGFTPEGAAALVILSSPLMRLNQRRIDDLALRHRLPSITMFGLLDNSVGLLSYGPDLDDMQRRAAVYVDRILKGTSVRELPVERPTKFELAVNLRTAKLLGLDLPRPLLLRADRVIR
jgi:putative ABC transport system substrate-binding protein